MWPWNVPFHLQSNFVCLELKKFCSERQDIRKASVIFEEFGEHQHGTRCFAFSSRRLDILDQDPILENTGRVQ